jgi:hypothetical protein
MRPREDFEYNTESRSPETQELTVIQHWKERLTTNPVGKLTTNQKVEGVGGGGGGEKEEVAIKYSSLYDQGMYHAGENKKALRSVL